MIINFKFRIIRFYLLVPTYSFKNSSSRIMIPTSTNNIKNIFLCQSPDVRVLSKKYLEIPP